jgi:hypothetical protein
VGLLHQGDPGTCLEIARTDSSPQPGPCSPPPVGPAVLEREMQGANRMSKLDLEFAMTYRLWVRGPMEGSDGSPQNPRTQFWEMSRATLEGPGIRATTTLPGIDWFTPMTDGYGRPHVQLTFLTDDGALVLLEYRGVVHASQAFQRAVENDTSTEWGDQYMRMALTFDTTSSRYAWLTQSLFLARGRLRAAKELEYEVYRVA